MKDISRKLYGRIYNRYSFCSYLEVKYLNLRKRLSKIKNYKESKKLSKLKNEIIEYYKETDDIEIKEILNYLKEDKNEMTVFNYSDMQESINNIEINVKYDESKELFYIFHQGKKMYFSRKFKLGERVKEYYKSLLLEQHIDSPHRYITENFKLDGVKCLVDAGGAEGIFSLENLDRAEKIYIFECDEEWIEALEATFKEYKEKIKIIKKFVSDKNNENEITLDEFQKNIKEKIDFIKMDIEGAEVLALKGFKNILEKNNNLRIIACVYHKSNDEKDIREILKGFKVEVTDRYMLFLWDKDLSTPYFRRGILRAIKLEKECSYCAF
ncbi:MULTISPECIES: FkbM family methyltransferase [Fusobacterium]|uniref:FkbM family methyltransferase n=1 Tax=Fusobacterium TaxID=848 RepID=UPI0008A41246|nr:MULTISPECIES: FkbM family methyltransferase [Fusobacterium]OFL80715.1 hypothetical protein HMPREF2747_13875 [Fusobacterium sp. HMSC073F01]